MLAPFPQHAVLSSYEGGTAVSDVANVVGIEFRRMSLGVGVKYCDTKFLLRPQVGTDL